MMTKLFISYSHDSSEHKAWVLELATRLKANGIDVILDIWDLQFGEDVTRFMEESILLADRVLMICSKKYLEKINNPTSGVGYERMIVSGQMIKDVRTKKFIPIISKDNTDKQLPEFLSSRLYVDFSTAIEFDRQFDLLLNELLNRPLKEKPVLDEVSYKSNAVLNQKNREQFPLKKIFISYSKKDLSLVNQFLDHLAPLQRDGLIESWYCTELTAGSDWDKTIEAHFNAADIVCFMVSPSFGATDYIYEYELKRAVDRNETDKTFKVVPIIMDFCAWQSSGKYNLAKFNALPYTAKPIKDFDNPNMAWFIVVECLRMLVQGFDVNTEDETGEGFVFAAERYNKQLKQLFERIVAGKVDKGG